MQKISRYEILKQDVRDQLYIYPCSSRTDLGLGSNTVSDEWCRDFLLEQRHARHLQKQGQATGKGYPKCAQMWPSNDNCNFYFPKLKFAETIQITIVFSFTNLSGLFIESKMPIKDRLCD